MLPDNSKEVTPLDKRQKHILAIEGRFQKDMLQGYRGCRWTFFQRNFENGLKCLHEVQNMGRAKTNSQSTSKHEKKKEANTKSTASSPFFLSKLSVVWIFLMMFRCVHMNSQMGVFARL